MDEAYRKKLEALSRGALGEEAFTEQQKQIRALQQGQFAPADTSITPEQAQLIRQAQLQATYGKYGQPPASPGINDFAAAGRNQLPPDQEAAMANEFDEVTPITGPSQQPAFGRLRAQLGRK